jgi:hypothetical protein
LEYILGIIRVLRPRYTEAGQIAALTAAGVPEQRICNLSKDATRQDIIQLTRPGTVWAIQHLHLIADPVNKRKKGGMRADLWKALDAIEKRGGVIWELYTGLRTDTKAGRDTMTRGAVETLARGRHRTERSDKRGRPKKEFKGIDLEKVKAIWDSRKLKTWADVEKKLPKGITPRDCWNMWGARNKSEE